MKHWHAYTYAGRTHTDSERRTDIAPSTYPPFLVRDWLQRPRAHIVGSFAEPDAAAAWLRTELEAHPPVDVAAFTVEDRMRWVRLRLAQDNGADIVSGYYTAGGQYVSRALVRCTSRDSAARCPTAP